MREILFRGKHIHTLEPNKKLDGVWVYGYLCSENYIWSDELCGDMLVDKSTIGQYTGLTDKNGKKIFEGDILDIHQTVNGYNQFVVEYDTYKFSTRYYNQETKKIHGWYNYSLDELFEINEWEKEIEVIGNIYDKEVENENN